MDDEYRTNLRPAFYGLDPHWFKSDDLYKIYVIPDCLCGGHIAGQVYDKRSAAVQLRSFYVLFRGRVQRAFECRRTRESRYDAMGPATPEFLAEDVRNFQIHRTHVVSVTVDRKRSLWTPYNVGTVSIELGTGDLRRFILVGEQGVGAIAETLRSFHPETAIVGDSTPLPKNRRPQRHAWARFVIMSANFLGFAVLCFAGAFWRVQNLPLLLLGAFNLWAAIYCYKLARKYRALPTEREDP